MTPDSRGHCSCETTLMPLSTMIYIFFGCCGFIKLCGSRVVVLNVVSILNTWLDKMKKKKKRTKKEREGGREKISLLTRIATLSRSA